MWEWLVKCMYRLLRKMKSRLMSYVVYLQYHFAENLIDFDRSDWVMYRNSGEIERYRCDIPCFIFII